MRSAQGFTGARIAADMVGDKSFCGGGAIGARTNVRRGSMRS